jgi:hypothetical protein
MKTADYWQESIACAAEECGAVLTDEQLAYIAGSVESSHENYSMAYPTPSSADFYGPRIKQLESELQNEREKTTCRECNGHGRITIQGPYHSANMDCDNCRGTGKV